MLYRDAEEHRGKLRIAGVKGERGTLTRRSGPEISGVASVLHLIHVFFKASITSSRLPWKLTIVSRICCISRGIALRIFITSRRRNDKGQSKETARIPEHNSHCTNPERYCPPYPLLAKLDLRGTTKVYHMATDRILGRLGA